MDLVVTSPPFLALRSYLPADHPDKGKEIGSEATPAEFIDTLLRVTDELRRVLAPHGSICVELGDTYAGGGGSGGDYGAGGWRESQPMYRQEYDRGDGRKTMQQEDYGAPTMRNGGGPGWPLAKSRTLIPSLYQIALAYGINPLTGQPSPAGQWRIRNIITWARPNPPVGALGDKWRPATSDLIVACTSPKRYWDDLATRRPFAEATLDRTKPGSAVHTINSSDGSKDNDSQMGVVIEAKMTHSGAPLLDYWVIPLLEDEEEKPYGPADKPTTHARTAKGVDSVPRSGKSADRGGNWSSLPELHETQGAPLLDYWVIPPGGYQGAHYAVFPEELVVPCIQAMCPQRVCVSCGEPSRRITETTNAVGRRPDVSNGSKKKGLDTDAIGVHFDLNGAPDYSEKVTLGWSDCGHDTWRPGLVLDPFAGSGTTLAVATGHGHDAIGIDIDSRNADLARDRVGPFLFEMV